MPIGSAVYLSALFFLRFDSCLDPLLTFQHKLSRLLSIEVLSACTELSDNISGLFCAENTVDIYVNLN